MNKDKHYKAVGTRTGSKIHLGIKAGTSSVCGVWGTHHKSYDLWRVNCAKCRSMFVGLFRWVDKETGSYIKFDIKKKDISLI